MSTQILIKQNDNARLLTDLLMIGDTPVDFTGYSTLKCLFKKGSTVVEASATPPVDLTTGVIEATIPVAVSSIPGQWSQEWEIIYVNNTQLTVPTNGYNDLRVQPDLNS